MSCDHELANEWARCSGKNASYITTPLTTPAMTHNLLQKCYQRRIYGNPVIVVFWLVLPFMDIVNFSRSQPWVYSKSVLNFANFSLDILIKITLREKSMPLIVEIAIT